jgi:hypothetical protein
MMTSMKIFALALFLFPAVAGFSQAENFPAPPGNIKPYKGVPGRITKYNNFNYIDIRDESGNNNRQSMGHYWEMSFTYDSVFRQKRKFKEFVENQIAENNGSVLFQDTLQVHFVIPSGSGNVWGRLILSNDKVYRLRLIQEVPFRNKISFDTEPLVVFDKYIAPVPLPPRVNFLPGSVIARVQQSKYDHQEFTWNTRDTLLRQKVMGPYWEMKIEVKNAAGQVDRHISSVEILESYYRACVNSGGKVLKSRPKELLFTLPLEKATLWCRITVSLDGIYFMRSLVQSDQDRTEPQVTINTPAVTVDSADGSTDR